MNALIPMQFDGRAIRVVEDGGEPWFVGKDVAEALGYVNPTDAMNNHCRGVAKRYPIVDSLGRTQEARILSEPDVLRLIVNSKLPAAERFERWVFEPPFANAETKEYIDAPAGALNTGNSGNWIKATRGAKGGTWFHPRLAMAFTYRSFLPVTSSRMSEFPWWNRCRI